MARGEQVIANVGKDLTIESLQDLSTYDSKQKSLGASVSLCILPFASVPPRERQCQRQRQQGE